MKSSIAQKTLSTFCAVSLLCSSVFAQQSAAPSAKKFDLTVDNIMRGFELTGYAPTDVRWSPDSQRLFFRWKKHDEPRVKEFDWYVVGRNGGGLKKLTEEEARQQLPPNGDWSKDKKQMVYAEDGDIFLYERAGGKRQQLTKTTDAESNPHFTLDQKRIWFVRQNNIFVMSLDGGLLVQMTDIRPAVGSGVAPSVPVAGGLGAGGQRGSAAVQSQQKGTDSQEFLKKEERELLEVVRERAQQREEQEAKRKKREQEREKRKPFNVPAGQTVGALFLSPDEKYVMASLFEAGTGAKGSIVPNYVTESAFTEDIPARTKVGDTQGRARWSVISVETGEVKSVDFGLKMPAKEKPKGENKPASAVSSTASASSGEASESKDVSAEKSATPKMTDRPVSAFTPQWSADGKHLVMNVRAADNKDRWLMQIDPATAKAKILFTEHNEAWIGGPGSFTLGWLPDHKRAYFVSERDGFAHLYTVNVESSEVKQLTSGNYEVTDVSVAEDETKFYLTTSEVSFFERHFYSMSFDGGARVQITSMPGNNEVTVSPDESTLAVLHSYSNKPTELYLTANKSGAEAKRLTASPSEEFLSYNWIDPPIVNFKARDGVTVYGRIYKPKNFQKGGPAVLFVHGAGYLQNVHKWWSSYFREYMFHHLLMERGFLVLDIDYRASSGYGRDWRTGIYRHMGGKDLSDHVDAVKYLINEHGVDAKRVGLYGGSYGGFITLMAMFTEPDVFAAGAALRPVTDWAHYNHGYTSNILNQPQDDAEAYRRSSPIYHAQGLKGALLICHGMVDVNVHYQDSVRLAQRLIELRKDNWELASYPVEDHAFVRPSSWADEYRRILKLFTVNLQNTAPSSGKIAPVKKR
jgi:dipeptidyl aminopeptidase/acylaminoacyl peptidase